MVQANKSGCSCVTQFAAPHKNGNNCAIAIIGAISAAAANCFQPLHHALPRSVLPAASINARSFFCEPSPCRLRRGLRAPNAPATICVFASSRSARRVSSGTAALDHTRFNVPASPAHPGAPPVLTVSAAAPDAAPGECPQKAFRSRRPWCPSRRTSSRKPGSIPRTVDSAGHRRPDR